MLKNVMCTENIKPRIQSLSTSKEFVSVTLTHLRCRLVGYWKINICKKEQGKLETGQFWVLLNKRIWFDLKFLKEKPFRKINSPQTLLNMNFSLSIKRKQLWSPIWNSLETVGRTVCSTDIFIFWVFVQSL